jgi:hypothetical protein
MVTIDDLTVSVKIEGGTDADELAFARLFDKHIERWRRETLAQQAQARRSARDRALGDSDDGAGVVS